MDELKSRQGSLHVVMPKWVRVSDGLPSEKVRVLVWYEEFGNGKHGIGWIKDGTWCGDPKGGLKVKVIAWMPLPEPPERGKA